MARPSSGGLELTFHKASKRWKKVINGKTHYFGSGKSGNDLKSYNAALKRYRDFVDKITKEKEQVQTIREALAPLHAFYAEKQRQVEEQHQRGLHHGWHPVLGRLPDPEGHDEDPDDFEDLGDDDDEPTDSPEDDFVTAARMRRLQQFSNAKEPGEREALLQGRSPIEFLAGMPPRRPRRATTSGSTGQVAQTIREYLEEQQQRVEVTKATRHRGRRQLSDRGFAGVRNGLSTFRAFVGTEGWGDAAHTETLLDGYRRMLEEKLTKHEYTAHTFNDKLKHLKPFVKWLYSKRKLTELPRNLDHVCAKLPIERSGKPLLLTDIHRLWAEADARMKCWIALALNCGYYSKDISDLVAADLNRAPGYLARRRAKTSVPSRHKLWPVTAQLIEQGRDDGGRDTGGRLFVTAKGTQLNTVQRDRVGTLFSRLARRVKVQAVFSQLRDTGAQFIESVARSNMPIDLALTQLYLAHADSRTAAYYVSNDPAQMPTPTLDAAIDRMADHFKLTLPDPAVEPGGGDGAAESSQAMVKVRVRRDPSGQVVEVRPLGRGRPPGGFTVEEMTEEQHVNTPLNQRCD